MISKMFLWVNREVGLVATPGMKAGLLGGWQGLGDRDSGAGLSLEPVSPGVLSAWP